MSVNPTASAARLRVGALRDGVLVMAIAGRLDSNTTGKIWRQATQRLGAAKARSVVVDATEVDYCDGSGIALFVHLRNLQHKAGGQLEIRGLRPEFQGLLEESDLGDLDQLESQRRPRTNLAEDVGQAVVGFWEDTRSLIGFVGELVSALGTAAMHPKNVRWRDVVRVAETAGVNALPIIVLVSFLMGVIMAFQGAISLRRFGADIFVANLVGLAMLRELGPLMTAIILAGRSGSAFAAELGTMTVREEIDALKTMGLDPVRFLVVTRVIAAVVMTPLLTVFADLLGLIGGAVVMRSFGIPLVTFYHQVQYQVTYGSFVGGLVKSFVFGILVAAIGCLRGLQTTTGASAVGESTTRAVVSGIVLIVITDGIFSVVFYYLNV
ncbi:MAG TPA: MlaE family lipid ABC transporter permease subunit [Candidatus Binatia bacterium]|nr:MlaE family lipid ABC transporter permease subunit [Candidatus Binatia bacterium]